MSDLISREQAIKAICKLPVKVDDLGYTWMIANDVLKQVDEVPSACTERTAKVYKKQVADRLYQFYCGECCQMIDCSFYEDYKSIKSYCGYCGAKLEWSDDE